MGNFNRIGRLLWTVRYLTPAQVANRSVRSLRQRWWRRTRRTLTGNFTEAFASPRELYEGLPIVVGESQLTNDIVAAMERARGLTELRFSFLNREVRFDRSPGWNDSRLSRLWRFHLHYFGCVQDLLIATAAGHAEQSFQTFRRITLSWIEENRLLAGDGWHPYTISLRVVNWLHAASGFAPQFAVDEPFRQRFFSSLVGQTKFLASNLEFDVRGNHLLENLRALIWAGVAFTGKNPRVWLETGLRVLKREVVEQTLSDGCHFERVPGYQLIVLKGLLEIALWLRRNYGGAPAWLDNAVRQMFDYTVALLPVGEAVPLLKDTAWKVTLPPGELVAAGAIYFSEPRFKLTEECGLYPQLLFGVAGRKQFAAWPVNRAARGSVPPGGGGYAVLRDDARGDHLVFDVGPPCPDYLPAHAHADLLSYELTVHGERVIVDSGVYEYTAGSWRDFFRSTRAHNTVEVDGQNQSEVWDSFRVARRARPRDVRWRETAETVIAQAAHDGYLRLSARVQHRRTLYWQKGEFWLVWDELAGNGNFAAASHVHFYPQLGLEAAGEAAWRIQGVRHPLWITVAGHETILLTHGQLDPQPQGWYSECFGARCANLVLTLCRRSTAPFGFGYVITAGKPAQLRVACLAGGNFAVTVQHAGHSRDILVAPMPASDRA